MPPANDTNPALSRLKQDLSGHTLGSLYLLHGEEAFLREHYRRQIRGAILAPGLEEFNLHAIQGRDACPRTIAGAVDCLPVFSERTLVLVSDYDLFKAPAAEMEAMTRLVSDLPGYVCLVLDFDVVEYAPPASRKKDSGQAALQLEQAVRAHGLIVPFPRQSRKQLTGWIARHFRAAGHDIDAQQAEYLLFLCGESMYALQGEIEKISAYAKERRITRRDIDAVATPELDANVFQLMDGVLEGEGERAVRVLGDLLDQQEPPIKILALLGKQLRQLYTARLAWEAHRDSGYLASAWKMHAYPAGKLMRAAPRFDLPWCRRAVIRAAQTDWAMKSSGGGDAALLTALVLELTHG